MRVAGMVSSILADALNFVPDLLFVAKSLIADSFLEELVEVEVILHEKLYVRRLKLQSPVPLNVRVGEYVSIERA